MRQRGLRMGGQAGQIGSLVIAIIFFVGTVNLPARQQAETPDPAVERGHKQFGQSCGFCHGADASGARAPDLIRSTLLAHDVMGDLIGEVVRHGRPDKGMPAQSLTDQQISDIAAYLHERSAESIRSSGLPNVYPVEKLLTGNAEAGKTFFNGTGRCSTCHSATGDLNGVAKKYTPIELEARMLYPYGKKPTATVTLPSGEVIKGTVVRQDEFEVALRDASGWYRSFARDKVKVEIQDPLAAHQELLPRLSQAEMHNLFAYLTTLK
jgi:cytochrome c oxidase cbb3-type subunit 3